MLDNILIGPWIRRFLLEHLASDRNVARNTQRSYRDTFCQLLPFLANSNAQRVEKLRVDQMTPEFVRQFLLSLEEKRGCCIRTRNQRLAAIHAFAGFVGRHSPEHIEWCGGIRAIPFKKGPELQITSLDKPELQALLDAPDAQTDLGRRDHTILLFLYNTGTRADEAAQALIADLSLAHVPERDHSSIQIRGKGNKLRRCPLWPQTVSELRPLIEGRAPAEHLFLNRRGLPITRFGIHTLVERYVLRASARAPSLVTKRVSPHTIRHTTATHLLRAGVDINTIRAWLGHVSLRTTNIYAEVDLEMKAKALAHCEVTQPKFAKRGKKDGSLLAFLQTL